MQSLELCAGGGGQALGLHLAGFSHRRLVEIDPHACDTLEHNIEHLNLDWGGVYRGDIHAFNQTEAAHYRGEIDLIAAGVPCPPFSKAGKQLGGDDERDLFPAALESVSLIQPLAVMLENVPGLWESKFTPYRDAITQQLHEMGYEARWQLIQSSDYGVPQLRPRVICVALLPGIANYFAWPTPTPDNTPTVGDALFDLMSSKGWKGAADWRLKANRIAPTLVGGSKKHGGPDLGPTRARAQWQALGVNGSRLGSDDEIPGPDFAGIIQKSGKIKPGFENLPVLTLRMAARIQGFPDNWHFCGSKTRAYQQIGNAFPPPVAEQIGRKIKQAIGQYRQASKAA